MDSTVRSRLEVVHNHLSSFASSPLDNTGFKVDPNVRRALSESSPVVALESTIITHGMPYPQNLQTALEVEHIVRENGAVPATIAIIKGVPCIGNHNLFILGVSFSSTLLQNCCYFLSGLSANELEYMAQNANRFTKTARRDIPHVVAKKGNGATTVSATMFFASKVGIRVFVTGGIGGVHRGGENTMDVSSDLTELGRTPVAVVCAGVKSILDIPRTLEYLETQGVPVVGYGTEEFPAFFTRTSGCKVPCHLDTPIKCAQLIMSTLALELGNGVLVAVPIPEEYEAVANPIESAINRALQEASDQHVAGGAITPFLLRRVNELTGGRSLDANIQLVKNNAKVGAQISVALSRCWKK